MNGTDHLLGIGKIMGNLSTLEVLLRIFLCEVASEQSEIPAAATSHVPETHMTNYDSLGAVIKKYNKCLTANESAYGVDGGVVDIRDAIAHGRLMALKSEFPLTMYKFGRAAEAMVPVELCVELTPAWLEEARARIYAQIDKVLGCGKSRGHQWPRSVANSPSTGG